MVKVDTPSWASLRNQMVDEQLFPRGVHHARLLEVMRRIPRECFVPLQVREQSYADKALPVGHGQTISQPYMTAWMLQAFAPNGSEQVLEIGTGTGYQAALLSQLAAEVDTVEIIPELATQAKSTFAELGIRNVRTHISDGSLGFSEFAPYDAILVAAGAPDAPQGLLDQLKDGGKLLIPIGDRRRQMLTLFQKKGHTLMRQPLGSCAFVPLLGAQGWPAA